MVKSNKKNRPTLKDIAHITGLGVTAVSRALSDAPDISTATKERVRLAAKQIGYHPNRAGVGLRTGKTNTISIILNTQQDAMGMTAPLIAGISSVIGKTNYHLMVTPYSPNQNPLDPIKYVVETNAADGIILSHIQPNDPRIRYLTDLNFPFTSHGRTDMGIHHAFFDYDNTAFCRQAVSIMANNRRSRICLLAPPNSLTNHRHFTTGFKTAMDKQDLFKITMHGVNADSDPSDIEAEINRLMHARHRPDGIICTNAQSAISVTSAIEAAGYTIGKDIDVIAKESFTLLKRFRPELIIFQENHHNAGQILANNILSVIKGEKPSDHQILEQPKLIQS